MHQMQLYRTFIAPKTRAAADRFPKQIGEKFWFLRSQEGGEGLLGIGSFDLSPKHQG
jgi:hypothetical protein